MSTPRLLPSLVFAALLVLALPLAAQTLRSESRVQWTPAKPSSALNDGYLGINIGRARLTGACMLASILCDDRDRPGEFYAGTRVSPLWSAELGVLNSGRLARDGAEGRAQGLNLSLVGRTRLGSSFDVYGKVGAMYSRSETSPAGNGAALSPQDPGFGLTYGGGVSYSFTPRISAHIEWDSHDWRFAGTRDPVRSTSLGLQFRY